MTPSELDRNIVRYGELKPCKTAFIDAHTPGSNRKENFTIIGGGVSESPDQHVHICDTPGFNIGAAGQPPHCRNSLHMHSTAEVFFVLKGTWRFFWGRHGTAGEVTLQEGDIFNIPTGIFRGFENISTDYGMIMAVLGGDDAGGGVIWAPQVIEDAKDHGLILGENSVLYDSHKGAVLPDGISPMRVLDEDEMALFPKITTAMFVPRFVARYLDMMALADRQAVTVIGEDGMLVDRPGFKLEFLSSGSVDGTAYGTERHEILMVTRGYWKVTWDGGETILAPGDVFAVPPGIERSLQVAMSGEASLFRVSDTDDEAGPTMNFVADSRQSH
jgi:quercetin dioxygenase-like cupin family protein